MRNGLHSKSHQLPELYFPEWEEESSHGHQFEKFDLDIEALAATFQFPSLYSTGSRSGKTVHIKNLRSQKYRLREEIPVFLAEENDSTVAIWYDIGQYGMGSSEEDAIQDLCETIVEYFELLNSEQNLGQQLESHRQFLLSIIEAI